MTMAEVSGNPLVSIVTPSYNQGQFIEDTILSVKNQDYPNIEHIIVDGGSTDKTLEILRQYEHIYNMRWVSGPDKGQADAVNKGFKVAKGEIIGWLNSDDCYFTRDVITDVVKAFKRNPTAHIIYGDLAIIDTLNRVTSVACSLPFFSKWLLRRRDYLPQPSMFLTRDVVRKEELNVALHYVMDYEYWLRLGNDYSFCHFGKILAAFRVHEKSKSVSDREKMSRERNLLTGRERPEQRGSVLVSLLGRLLKIKATHRAWSLYRQPSSYFAFDVSLIPRKVLITRQIIPQFLLERMPHHEKSIYRR